MYINYFNLAKCREEDHFLFGGSSKPLILARLDWVTLGEL